MMLNTAKQRFSSRREKPYEFEDVLCSGQSEVLCLCEPEGTTTRKRTSLQSNNSDSQLERSETDSTTARRSDMSKMKEEKDSEAMLWFWERDFWTKKLLRELLAEGIGTGIIVLLGTGAVMSAIFTEALVGLFQIAAVWIIGVTLAISTTASISGAHLNPAVSIAFALLRPRSSFHWNKVLPYVVAQMAGAVFASWVNYLMYASVIRQFENEKNILRGTESGLPSARAFGEYYVDPVTTQTAFLVEAVGTAVLAFVIFSLTHPGNDTMKNNVYVPPFIGMTVGGLISFTAPLTQAGFNPARDFGPRIVAYAAGWTSVAFDGWWVYVVAPIVGAPVGAFIADKLLYADYEDASDVTDITIE